VLEFSLVENFESSGLLSLGILTLWCIITVLSVSCVFALIYLSHSAPSFGLSVFAAGHA